MAVSFSDLQQEVAILRDEIAKAIEAVVSRNDFILGAAVREFEEEFARYCGVRHCIGCGSGTDALELSLRCLDITVGDEVVLPANTFNATAAAVSLAGAKPVLVDCDADTFLIDIDQVQASLSPRTKAIIPVHLFGQPAEMDKLTTLAKDSDVAVIEDAAQAHGAAYGGKRTGSLGDIGSFSFYPSKNLGCFGDGGAVVTDDDDVDARIRRIRNLGVAKKYDHDVLGRNSRLDTLQAAILSVKLSVLTKWNTQRQGVAAQYRDALSDVEGILLPTVADGRTHVFHLYVVRVLGGARNALAQFLLDRGIVTGIHYPIPLHLQGAFQSLGYRRGDFPRSEKVADEILSLPMTPFLTPDDIDSVAGGIRDFFAMSAR